MKRSTTSRKQFLISAALWNLPNSCWLRRCAWKRSMSARIGKQATCARASTFAMRRRKQTRGSLQLTVGPAAAGTTLATKHVEQDLLPGDTQIETTLHVEGHQLWI